MQRLAAELIDGDLVAAAALVRIARIGEGKDIDAPGSRRQADAGEARAGKAGAGDFRRRIQSDRIDAATGRDASPRGVSRTGENSRTRSRPGWRKTKNAPLVSEQHRTTANTAPTTRWRSKMRRSAPAPRLIAKASRHCPGRGHHRTTPRIIDASRARAGPPTKRTGPIPARACNAGCARS